MLTIILKILGILGILLLAVLGIVLVVLLLVLFFPVTYQADGRRDSETTALNVRVKWLFGFLRILYQYPEPGTIRCKLLWFTLYDSGKASDENAVGGENPGAKTDADKNPQEKARIEEVERKPMPEADVTVSVENPAKPDGAEAIGTKTDPTQDQTAEKQSTENAESVDDASQPAGRIAQIFQRIRYTVEKICAKIKRIRSEISFYKKLWQDPETQGLLRHAGKRMGRILQRLRPKKLKITATVGTGSPDTTGYAYALYGMLLPKLGSGICITPDFEQAILEGNFQASGHFTLFALLFHAVSLVLDKRLRLLIRRLKKHRASQQKQQTAA